MSLANLRAGRRAAAFFAVTGLLVATYPLAIALGPGARRWSRRFWSRFTCWLLGIRVSVSARGAAPFTACPTLFVANHVSYLDAVIVGSHVDALFTAKSEVDGWPFFGFIARLTGTLFLKRHWRQARVQRDLIAAGMRRGESYVLFPEGTSSNGLGVKPFKTSLLSVAEPWIVDRPVAAQGLTIAYRRLTGSSGASGAYGPANCDLYAWYGDMTFAPHLWEVAKLPGLEVELLFQEPVFSWSVASRKPLTRAIRAEVVSTLAGPSSSAGAAVAAVAGSATRDGPAELPQAAGY